MTEETVILNFREKKVIWNREVVYHDYESAGGSQVFIIAGNESNWIELSQGIYFTPDFYVMLVSFDLTSVTLYINYGPDNTSKWRCSGEPSYICYQVQDSDPSGYATEAECKEACKDPIPGSCSDLKPDTWEPSKIVAATGEAVSFNLRSKDPNKTFFLYEDSFFGRTLKEGKTDSDGCYEGTIPAQEDNSYNILMCYPTAGVCLSGNTPYRIRWGDEKLPIQELALYGIGALILTYAVVQYWKTKQGRGK